MTWAGLDVGSRTIVLVTLEEGISDTAILDTGPNPLKRCRELLVGRGHERLVVTGYGRHLVGPAMAGEAVSEIRAYAVGAKHLYPDCRTVIDVGGQDCKVTLLADDGQVQRFEMNDRCAAGTGRFLEVMASALGVGIGEFGDLALRATKSIQINSLCTVFAESEVVSLITRGEEASVIALALHEAVSNRIAAMVRRVQPRRRVVFAGGGALNRCLHRLLCQKLGMEVTVPHSPQCVGALGAALLAKAG